MYVKIFKQILGSSLMELDVTTRWVWITILASADDRGYVYGTTTALARIANVSQEQMERALIELSEPDPLSTSPDEDGRRITQVSPNVWKVVNFERYKDLERKEDQRAAWRERQQRRRAQLANGAGEKKAGPDPKQPAQKQEPVITFPTVGKQDSWHLYQDTVDDLQQAFPSLDVLAEARKALAWVNASPDRRKTPRGMRRFLFTWMSKAVDSRRGVMKSDQTSEQSDPIDWGRVFEGKSQSSETPPPASETGGGLEQRRRHEAE